MDSLVALGKFLDYLEIASKMPFVISENCSRQIPRNEKVHRLRHFNLATLKLPTLPYLASPRESKTKASGNSSILDSESSATKDEEDDPPPPAISRSLPDEKGICVCIDERPFASYLWQTGVCQIFRLIRTNLCIVQWLTNNSFNRVTAYV
jgi:hypothetical protein